MLENELQGVMQVADRFHIHQNLLDAVKKALYKEMPESVVAPAAISDDSDDSSAKISEGKKLHRTWIIILNLNYFVSN